MWEVMVTYPFFVCRSVKSPVSKSTFSYCRDDTFQTPRQVTLQSRIAGAGQVPAAWIWDDRGPYRRVAQRHPKSS